MRVNESDFASLNNLQKQYVLKNADYEAQKRQLKSLEDELASASGKSDILAKAGQILNMMADSQRKDACKKLEDVCSYALQYATGRNLKMNIEMGMLRNKVAAEISVVKPDTGVENFPMDGGGGGLADIIAMALRFVLLSTYQAENKKPIDGPVILDEPAKNVSSDYIENVSNFLLNATEDFGRQIILSTHNEFIADAAPKRYRFYLGEDDSTEVLCEIKDEGGGQDEA